MKLFALAVLSAAPLAAAVSAQAGETDSMPSASATALPAEAEGDAATWLLLVAISMNDGDVSALQSCLDQDRVASMVNSLTRKLEAVAMPVEASQPWSSCGEAGCP